MRKRAVLVVLALLFAVTAAFADGAWNCPACGREGNTGNFCGGCGTPMPDPDAALKARIAMPYGLEPGMTVEEANQCMEAAGFQPAHDANEGATMYYYNSVVEGAEAASSLMSVFGNGVIHVIHFYREDPGCTRENPCADYLRIRAMLEEEYGAVSYTMDGNGSDGWVNGSVEVHFGHLESGGNLYYVLAYWYLPEGVQYNGF